MEMEPQMIDPAVYTMVNLFALVALAVIVPLFGLICWRLQKRSGAVTCYGGVLRCEYEGRNYRMEPMVPPAIAGVMSEGGEVGSVPGGRVIAFPNGRFREFNGGAQ